ncbi:hypothetical protein D3C78_1803500 [compost metagenome]
MRPAFLESGLQTGDLVRVALGAGGFQLAFDGRLPGRATGRRRGGEKRNCQQHAGHKQSGAQEHL